MKPIIKKITNILDEINNSGLYKRGLSNLKVCTKPSTTHTPHINPPTVET